MSDFFQVLEKTQPLKLFLNIFVILLPRHIGHLLVFCLKSFAHSKQQHICLQGRIIVSILSVKQIEHSFPSL